MRVINADAIEYFALDDVYNIDVMVAYKDRIDNMPTVDAEIVKHGYWIDLTATEPCTDTKPFKCSICGRRAGYGQHRMYKHCPACGARMDGES